MAGAPVTAASLRRAQRAASAAASDAWIRDEPALLGAGLAELRRLFQRASRRWRLALAGALAVTALVAVKTATKRPEFSAEVVLRMVEGTEHNAPLSSEQLRDYVWEVVFSGPRLLGIIKRFNLNPRWADKDPSYAVDDFRDAINLTIWQSDFIGGAETRHSARLTISYRTGVRTTALPVVQALGELLADTEGAQRRATAAARVASTKRAVDSATRQADQLRAEAAVGQDQTAGLFAAARRASEGRLRQEQAAAISAELQLKAASEGQSLRFETVDAGREPPEQLSDPLTTARTGLVALLLAFPVLMTLIGAFDPYVIVGEDVARLGIPLLGLVPGNAAPKAPADNTPKAPADNTPHATADAAPRAGEPDKPSV